MDVLAEKINRARAHHEANVRAQMETWKETASAKSASDGEWILVVQTKKGQVPFPSSFSIDAEAGVLKVWSDSHVMQVFCPGEWISANYLRLKDALPTLNYWERNDQP